VFYEVNYPHSLGIFYSAFTQFLGFPKFGDEYKVMGLSAYGKPKYLKKMEEIVILKPRGRFELNLEYFQHYKTGDQMQWYNTAPSFGRLYSDKLYDLFGPERKKEQKITSYYMDVTASVQAMYEKASFHILNYAYELTGNSNLCLAGGSALNSLANGKIYDNTPFIKRIYIQPAAHDGGGAVGAAYYLYNHILDKPRNFIMKSAFYGPQYSDEYISKTLNENTKDLNGISINKIDNTDELIRKTAKYLSKGKIVGWFQGRMEWGPRALGNRSILVDPRRREMIDILNARIKKREWFRPFAPSILEEYTSEYFEKDYPAPFMIRVYPIKKEKQSIIPAVTHIDGTGRLQTVNRNDNPLYWKLINEFKNLTGVPVLLNTSFNENEPIVCTPEEALDCFLRTRMDILVLGNYILERQ
jgi:carbamoyltransferase